MLFLNKFLELLTLPVSSLLCGSNGSSKLLKTNKLKNNQKHKEK